MDELRNDLMQDFEEAIEAQEALRQYTNIGKYDFDIQYIVWENKKPLEVSREEYHAAPKSGKQMNILFTVDIQEFKPDLTFSYERQIKFGGAEWYEIVQPSLVETFNINKSDDNETKRAAAKALVDNRGKYAFVDDVPSKKKMYNGKPLKYPAIRRVFDSREEFFAAAKERFGIDLNGAPTENAAEPTSQYDSDLISTVKTLAQNMKDPQAIASAIGGGVTADDVKNILNQ